MPVELKFTSSLAIFLARTGLLLLPPAGNRTVRNEIHAFSSHFMAFFTDNLYPVRTSHAAFSWDKLGLFDVHSNLQDLLSTDALTNLTSSQTLGDLYTKFETAVDAFCQPEK